MRTYDPMAGETIEHAALEMAVLAATERVAVKMSFNDIELVTEPGEVEACRETAKQIAEQYYAASKKRHEEAMKAHEEFLKTPAGEIWAAKDKEIKRKEKEAVEAGVLQITTKDAEAAAGWKKTVEVNTDPYGACGVRYASRWANFMEKKIAEGAKLEEIADATSQEADLEGITGFMYGCSVGILSKVWIHGEELRRWHNLTTQMGHEGEKANESGGVLNPAIINIGKKEEQA